ncbi:hypothetical protein ACLUTX_07170 [Enterobacterales bacterium AE_CKDN230030158-1A_HGKHYDSX7]
MSPKEWLYVWSHIPRYLQRDLITAIPVLILAFFALVFAGAVGFIVVVSQVVNYLRQPDSPYPGMSDTQFAHCLEIAKQTLAARQAVERLGATPAPGPTTDSVYAREANLTIEYRSSCDESLWAQAFEAGQRKNGVPPATSPEGWLAADRY